MTPVAVKWTAASILCLAITVMLAYSINKQTLARVAHCWHRRGSSINQILIQITILASNDY